VQRGRNTKAEVSSGLQVNHRFEYGWLHYRELSRLVALENAAGIDACLSVCVGNARSIADETARRGVLAEWIDRGNLETRGPLYNVLAPVDEKRVGPDKKCVGPPLGDGGENRIELVRRADVDCMTGRSAGFAPSSIFPT
jgi:hypothetical protein